MAGLLSRLKHAWNLFRNPNTDDELHTTASAGGISYYPPDRARMRWSNERSIISSIYTRLSIDIAQIELRHVRVDENGRYLEDIPSALNSCLTLEANIDQAARHFRQNIVMKLFGTGVAAVVPVDTSMNPAIGSFDIHTMRVGEVTDWREEKVKVKLFNQAKQLHEEVVVEKRTTAIIENPLYAVMNEQNSTLQRLIRKLNLLDAIDEQSSSGKLDIIIQLPYVIKSEARKQQAVQRKNELEEQLRGSKYGVAYADGTEKIVQLNRPAENNLMEQVKYLTEMLYSQLGLTLEVMNGTADEATMLNYINRTVEPIVAAIVEAMRRTFLTKTARTQRQTILYFRDPFKLVPISQLAEIGDKFIRNQIATSNDMRQVVGWKPSKDPGADKLQNPNMPAPSEPATSKPPQKEGDSQNGTRLQGLRN